MIHKLCIQFCFVCETIMDIRHIFLIFCYISDKPTLKWHLKTKPTMIVHFICLSDREQAWLSTKPYAVFTYAVYILINIYCLLLKLIGLEKVNIVDSGFTKECKDVQLLDVAPISRLLSVLPIWKWKWRDMWPSMVTHTRNLCSAFIPSKVDTHTHTHTHTHTVNVHPEQWAAIYAAAPGEQLGVRCLAQGHLGRSIEGGRQRCIFTPSTYNSCRTWDSNSTTFGVTV